MATQALYRRYRPRRFSEVRGQEHIVNALRNSVIHQREGQAYLFSGPRGTGKTTSARILAKVLNCERPVDGEPCCECESCLAVERGTSYDVHELDAASNNGVDAMRDLIEKASLGTPGRHKVYILDEVHMLSKQAEAALLKTLEEPPPHVVFVLATTDPQKVSDTIRSRTQHLRFHLLPMDELEQHVRWVASDAGLDVSEAALQAALEQGGGSARDTLSALELVASTGGDELDVVDLGEFVESLIELDPGRALTAVAHAVRQGRDPRTLTEDVVRHLRDCFLSLMAPELVALPDAKAALVAEQASRLGAGKLVRAMERLGEMLVEMRHAPDARLLLEVALVQLTHDAASGDMGAVLDRLDRLEKSVAEGGPRAATPASPVDPATGRVQLGGRARREAPSAPPRQLAASEAVPARPSPAAAAAPAPASGTDADRAPTAPAAASGQGAAEQAAAAWQTQIVPGLKPLVRAIFSVPRVLGVRNGALTLGAPNDAHRAKCEQHRAEVEAAIATVVGAKVTLSVVTDGGGHDDPHDDLPVERAVARGSQAAPSPAPRPAPRPEPAGARADSGHDAGHQGGYDGGYDDNVVSLRPATPPPADDEIDLDDLVDAPPESVVSPIDRLAQAFPGSELIDERR
jgi:DNA polymerase-3 subunit gamma/tau